MTNKLFKLASLALVAGFMTSSLDVMGMNNGDTEINGNNGSQIMYVAHVRLGESSIQICYDSSVSVSNIYNAVCSKCKEVINTDDEFLRQCIEEFSTMKAEFYSTDEEMLCYLFCTIICCKSVMELKNFKFDLGVAGFSNQKLVIDRLSINLMGNLSVKQQLCNAINGRVVQELERNAEPTKNKLAEYMAFSLICDLQIKTSQIESELNENPRVTDTYQIYL